MPHLSPSSYTHHKLHRIPSTPISSFSFPAFISTTTKLRPPPPPIHTLLSLLRQFSKTLTCIKSIHAQTIIHALSTNEILATKFVKIYSNFGHLRDAHHIFDQIPERNTLQYNTMIGGYLKNEHFDEVLDLYRKMRSSNVEIDARTCTFALKACAKLLDIESGREIMRDAMDSGVEYNCFFGSSAISFLVKFGFNDEARDIFEDLVDKDVVCWNSMVGGYVQAGCFDIAFRMFFKMQECGIKPTPVTMVNLIQGCIGIGSLRYGKCVHAWSSGLGMGGDILVVTSLIDMYSKMGDIESASKLFIRMSTWNLVSWNAMLSGYVKNGLVYEAFTLFSDLVLSGRVFDSGTMSILLQGCAQLSSLKNGKILHGAILRREIESNVIVETALVDLYAKSGALNLASAVFRSMKEKNVISWTALLMGFAQNGYAAEALKFFQQMQEVGVDANIVTLVSLLHACAYMGSLKKGQSVHAYLTRHGFPVEDIVRSALIDMYAKCGKLNSCKRIFEKGLMSRDVVLWNSMITSYGTHGHGSLALGLYNHMKENGIKPDQTTFISLLSSCSHSGLVEEGLNLFNRMHSDHDIRPSRKHYACLIDLLGRAGQLEEAEAMIKQMPFEADSAVLEALLSGCLTHRNIDLGVRTANKLLSLDAMNPGIYVVLSNIYAEGGKWAEVKYVRNLMRKRNLRKTPGYSLIEVTNAVHTFLAGDESDPYWAEIYQMLESIRLEIEDSGYMVDTNCVLRDVDESMKKKLLWGHSERLAIAFGLIKTPSGSPIRIIKNLRVCGDCHAVTMFISKLVQREIIVRDINRFHHFVDGKCSCGGYW